MTAQLLFIGSTGNIGASVLEAIVEAYPDLLIEALVRSEADASHLNDAYPGSVTASVGSLSDLDLLEKKAAEASIIINCGPDTFQEAGLASVLRGLSVSSSASSRKFYIHTSGCARTWDPPDGATPGRIWDDTLDLHKLATAPTVAHVPTDLQVGAANTDTLHTAIVNPTFVLGRSPSKTHAPPGLFPYLLSALKAVGGAFVIGPGKNMSGFVENSELAKVYVALVGDALKHLPRGEKAVEAVNEEVWGPKGYFFGTGLEISWREFIEDYLVPSLKRCGGEAWVPGEETKEMDMEEVVNLMVTIIGDGDHAVAWGRHIALGLGVAMRVRPTRTKKYLGVEIGTELPGLDDAVRATLAAMKA